MPSIREGIRRNQITLINSSVTVILIGIVIFVLLNRASSLQMQTTEESITHLAGQTANEVQSLYFSYFDIVRTVSQTMQGYANIELNRRRDFINDIMMEIISSNQVILNIYTLWKPNELDGLDSYYANIPGSYPTGQFVSGYSREGGPIEHRLFGEYITVMDSTSPNLDLLYGVVSEPKIPSVTLRARNTRVVDIQFPIMRDEVAVGFIGTTINLERLQQQIESLSPFGTGRIMVCTRTGTIVAHKNQELLGANIMFPEDPSIETIEPIFSEVIANDIFNNMIIRSFNSNMQTVIRTPDTLYVGYPLRPAGVAFDLPSNVTTSRWVVITAVPLETIMAPINTLLRFSIIFIMGAAVFMVFVVLGTSRSLTQRTKALQHDLERASAMQDNLKYGLFLLDNKLIVQGAYSKALEKILSIPELSGKNFVDLLASSIKANEKDGLLDYFDMFFSRSFDDEMLASINPIVELNYESIDTGEKKSLRTNFTRAVRGRSEYILGTMEDVTAEKELEKQLMLAETQRETEMRSIFQVIQLDPRVLSDFVADAEYEFESINDLLKSKKELHKNLLVDIFQSVHAIKSNALILNLENFSEKLHKLESSVRALQEKSTDILLFDDFLGLLFEIDEAMKEIDQLRVTVSKIENFRNVSGIEKNQEQYVLVETLNRVCSKTQDALNKKVRLVVEEIDTVVMNYGPRRQIKEILTQLIRNAVYHGIETPEEREPVGKDPQGEIRFSIKYRDNQIFIKFTDNGKGIDFDKILEKAEANKLIGNKADAKDKNYLLKTIFMPGFSTTNNADFHAGRGIGLSLVKDRVKDLHGNITVSTTPGKGTTFIISIPMELQMPIGNVS